MRETALHLEAFEYYYNKGESRNYKDVARQFNCGERTVCNWGSKPNWQARVTERDRKVAERVERTNTKTIAERKADLLKVAEYTIFGKGQFAERLTRGEVKIKDIHEFDKMVKAILLLMGEATERTANRIEDDMTREALLHGGFTPEDLQKFINQYQDTNGAGDSKPAALDDVIQKDRRAGI